MTKSNISHSANSRKESESVAISAGLKKGTGTICNMHIPLGSFLRARLPFAFVVLRFCYQAPFILASKFRKNIHVPCARVFGTDGEHLFGYYDKSPWDANGKHMVCLQVPFADRHPSVHDAASIELIELETGRGSTLTVGTTRAWNLQQGCRLQWLGPDFRKRIILNDFREGRLVAVILDIDSGSERVIDQPVYDVTKDGKSALSLDFERLHVFRPGYGYDRGQHPEEYDGCPWDEGIWHIDIETGVCRLIISLAQIVEDVSDFGQHISSARFNHIMINPSGNRFMFLYRWKQGGTEFTKLYTSDMDGTNIYCLVTDGMVSHATWKNDNEILAWARRKDTGDRFYLFLDRSDYVTSIGSGILKEDGHPSFSPCNKYILLDTYADRARERSLYIFNMYTSAIQILGRFYSPFRYSGETRCDLHPRWKQDGSQVCFDSAHEARRQVYIVDVSHASR